MIDVMAYPVRAKNQVWRDIAGEVVIIEGDGVTVRMLNGAASAIWSLADGSRPVREIGDALSEQFEVAPEVAHADTLAFLEELHDARLISFQTEPSPGVEEQDGA